MISEIVVSQEFCYQEHTENHINQGRGTLDGNVAGVTAKQAPGKRPPPVPANEVEPCATQHQNAVPLAGFSIPGLKDLIY